jgi:hypothetical protein
MSDTTYPTRFTSKYGSCPLLGPGNYTEWSLNVRILLRGAHALGIVDGSEPAPASTTTTIGKDYVKRKDTAITLLWNSLTPAAQELVAMNSEEPYEMWNILKDRLDVTINKVAAARIREQFNIKQ